MKNQLIVPFNFYFNYLHLKLNQKKNPTTLSDRISNIWWRWRECTRFDKYMIYKDLFNVFYFGVPMVC